MVCASSVVDMGYKMNNPGSQKAVDKGCICPILDNEFGSYEATGGMFTVTEGCPLHWPITKKTKMHIAALERKWIEEIYET